jgi:hypothetical protein
MPSFPSKPVTLSVMGTTLGKFGGGLDDEYHVVSSKHGGNTIPMAHPNYRDTKWESSYKSGFIDQERIRAERM